METRPTLLSPNGSSASASGPFVAQRLGRTRAPFVGSFQFFKVGLQV